MYEQIEGKKPHKPPTVKYQRGGNVDYSVFINTHGIQVSQHLTEALQLLYIYIFVKNVKKNCTIYTKFDRKKMQIRKFPQHNASYEGKDILKYSGAEKIPCPAFLVE